MTIPVVPAALPVNDCEGIRTHVVFSPPTPKKRGITVGHLSGKGQGSKRFSKTGDCIRCGGPGIIMPWHWACWHEQIVPYTIKDGLYLGDNCGDPACPYHPLLPDGRSKRLVSLDALVDPNDHPCPVCLVGALAPWQDCEHCRRTGMDPEAVGLFSL